MTNEEKARAYDEALERAKAAIDIAADKDLVKGVATTIFPELRESEEERIRKALVWHLKAGEDFVSNGVTKAECIAYLEKQKEQVTDESDKIAAAYQLGRSDERKQQEPKPTATLNGEPIHTENQSVDIPLAEWSEEDADILNCCISSIEEAKENRYAYKETDGDTSYDREIAFLKSLRPSWKPSEEQMEALEYVIRDYREDSCNATANYLQEILDQIKKL